MAIAKTEANDRNDAKKRLKHSHNAPCKQLTGTKNTDNQKRAAKWPLFFVAYNHINPSKQINY